MRIATALAAMWAVVPAAADWGQFRGPGAQGLAAGAKLPRKFSPTENLAWKADLPGRGLSSPVVAKGKVFVTASGGIGDARLYVLCFGAESGKKLWQREFRATGRVSCHPTMCMATPTPATDGERVVAFYSTNDVVCLDLAGNVQWFRGLGLDYPLGSNTVGMSSSVVIGSDTAILQVENQADSYAAGLNLATGETRWRLPRPPAASWASPVVYRDKDRDVLLLQSPDRLTAHEPGTGKLLWTHTAKISPVPSVTVADGKILVPAGQIEALDADVKSLAPERKWTGEKFSTGTPSPLIMEGKAYAVAGPFLKCADLATGKLLWQLRMKGSFWSSPVGVGGLIYLFNQDGECHVVRPLDKEGEILAVNELKERIDATPAIAGDALFIRSDKTLWKFATK